jgi:anti-anti-sigma factor
MLNIDVERTEDIVVVRCGGRLVRGTAIAILRDAVISERDTRIVVLDMSELETIDAGGLTALVSLHHWTKDRGIQLKLVNPTHFVLETLHTLRLDEVFDISTLQDALVVLANPVHQHAHYAACS